MQNLDKILSEAEASFAAIDNLDELEQDKARYLGKSGALSEMLKQLGKMPAEERRTAGAQINQVKDRIELALQARRESLRELQLQSQLAKEALDVTLPGRGLGGGGLHPVTMTLRRIEELFRSVGFAVAEGPEIESDFYNFTALNTPEDHPARSMHDTFYVEGGDLLRTHTSPIQVHYMLEHQPPIKVIAPGRVYRRDSDLTHTPMFHQVEGLLVDKGVTFADLKGVLLSFARQFFGPKTKLRFRPHFFPFTEPSAEVDIYWEARQDWLEILGAGMVHPNVLHAVKIDPEKYTGFAFGMGVERIAMLKYGVEDIRQFFENDVRFLRQFE